MGTLYLTEPDVKKLEARKDIKGLIKALKYKRDIWVRCRAAEALGKIGDVRAIDPLIRCLNDQNSFVKEAASKALANMGKSAVEPLIKILEDTKEEQKRPSIWSWKELAARALGKTRDTRAIEPLIQALENSNASIRRGAAEGLGETGDVRAVEPLVKALQDESWLVRVSAAEALGKIGDVRAVEPLIRALEDKIGFVIGAAASALGKIGDVRAIEPLRKAASVVRITSDDEAAIEKQLALAIKALNNKIK